MKPTEIREKPHFNKKILIIEDNTELRNYLHNELKEYYDLSLASNGEDALKKLNKSIT